MSFKKNIVFSYFQQVDSNSSITPVKPSNNRHLLKSGIEASLAAERGRLWIEEKFHNSEVMDPKTIDMDKIYTPWSNWSKRCKRKGYKQVRRRRCAVPAICGNYIIKVCSRYLLTRGK